MLTIGPVDLFGRRIEIELCDVCPLMQYASDPSFQHSIIALRELLTKTELRVHPNEDCTPVSILATEYAELDEHTKGTLYVRYCAAAVCSMCIDSPTSYQIIGADGSTEQKVVRRS